MIIYDDKIIKAPITPTHSPFESPAFVVAVIFCSQMQYFVIFVSDCDCMLQVVRLCAKSREAVSSPVEHLTLHYQVQS